jgi:UDP-N-acetylglucosamine--N-acetylmuramyl-(pentapeptide) pyrophosphoryl-undecaprenol N-acetylglucosamine transferase
MFRTEHPDSDILWVGGEGGMEEALVKRTGIPFRTIPAAGVHGVGLSALPGNLARLGRGFLAARRILKEYKPDVLFFTGGYLAAPMALAGRNIPILLYVPDIEPALAIKSIARFADMIAVTAPASQDYHSKRTRLVQTGYPVRAELRKWDRKSGRKALHLHDQKPVLLVTGGSRGARSINQAVLANLPALLNLAQVIHISGQLDWSVVESAANSLDEALRKDYHAFPYLHEEMGAALAGADLVVSRAGASVLGEYPLFGLPAILVPYPHAWRYQKVNAEYLASRGAAVILADDHLEQDLLRLVQLLLTDRTRRESMQAALRPLANPQAARQIAGHLYELAGEVHP